jgi:hypothetical protein
VYSFVEGQIGGVIQAASQQAADSWMSFPKTPLAAPTSIQSKLIPVPRLPYPGADAAIISRSPYCQENFTMISNRKIPPKLIRLDHLYFGQPVKVSISSLTHIDDFFHHRFKSFNQLIL